MNRTTHLDEMARTCKEAFPQFARLSTKKKNDILLSLAKNILASKKEVLAANQLDLDAATGMSDAMRDRLNLHGRLEGIADDLKKLAALPDPIGTTIESRTLENGLRLFRQRVPIGVLGIIYEARPNVTIDAASLCIKTGNCTILRGGSETLHTNRALVAIIHKTLKEQNVPSDAIQFIDSPDRALVNALLQLYESVDLIIPRGGAGLHRFCRENSKIPVITGGIGICHLFVDESADLEKSLQVIHNAKTQRPTVCNALDTLLVHEKIAKQWIPQVINTLEKSGVKFKLDEKALHLCQGKTSCQKATKDDWDTEWLSLVLGIKIVSGIEEALQHIQRHSSGHSDGILTENNHHAEQFVNEVDSAAVYVNASTRFTDGGQFGLGVEVAISTQKLHARGPMGLEALTSYKWIINGNYHTRT